MEYILDTNICIYIIKKKPTSLAKSGTPIGPLDTLIAAHTKSLKLTLVTNNEKEFKRVAGLNVEN